jgi:Cep192 domain 4
MAEGRKAFWTTLPGVISGIAAIVTGLGVLIPLLVHGLSNHTDKNAASQRSSPSATSSMGSDNPTSTAGGAAGTGSPIPSEGSSPFPTGGSSSPGSGPGGALGIAADPSSVNFGAGKGTPDPTVTINNPGSASVTIEKVEISGTNASAFTITSTTCGDGSTVPAQQSCQVTLHFNPPALGAASAALKVYYHPPQSSFTTIQLSGTGLIG